MTAQRTRPDDLAGRWLTKFFTDHLAGERAASPRTIASYRDAMKLLLTWFKDAERIPPEKLRLADIDRPRVLQVPGLAGGRAGLLDSDPQPAPRGDQVVLPLHRHRAARPPRAGHPDPRDPAEENPGPQLGHLTADEVKALLAQPGTASGRAVRDTVLLAFAYDTAARVQELCDLDVADVRTANPMTVTIHGKGSKTRYVPVMDPTARLLADYLDHLDPHPGLGADADPAVPRTEPLQADQIRDRQAPGPPRPGASEHATPTGLRDCRSHPTRSGAPERCT